MTMTVNVYQLKPTPKQLRRAAINYLKERREHQIDMFIKNWQHPCNQSYVLDEMKKDAN
jgi:hypothetical protein